MLSMLSVVNREILDWVLVTAPDDIDVGRVGQVKDTDGSLYLVQFYDGKGAPRAWLYRDEFSPILCPPADKN